MFVRTGSFEERVCIYMCKGSQLTLKQRNILETLLNEDHKLCDIASVLDGYPRGIRYEIMTHRTLFIRKNQINKCGIQLQCKRKRLCHHCDSGLCKYCFHIHCDSICPDFCHSLISGSIRSVILDIKEGNTSAPYMFL